MPPQFHEKAGLTARRGFFGGPTVAGNLANESFDQPREFL
jgi:hypothetical protein